MSDEYIVTCKTCGRVEPNNCNRADCPLENYFWDEEDSE